MLAMSPANPLFYLDQERFLNSVGAIQPYWQRIEAGRGQNVAYAESSTAAIIVNCPIRGSAVFPK